MPITINDVSYAGEVSSAFVARAMTGSPSVTSGSVYVRDGIKKKYTIPRLVVNNLVQSRKPTPAAGDSAGLIQVDAQVLDPKDYMIYNQFNPRDFEEHWLAAQLSDKLLDRALPVSFESFLLQQVLKFHDSYHETAMWQSDLAAPVGNNFRYYDGFLKKMRTAPGINRITGPTVVALSETNILSKLRLVKDAIPDALKDDPRVKFLVSTATKNMYVNVMEDKGYNFQYSVGKVPLNFSGYPLVALPGLVNNCIIAVVATPDADSNLWVGINSRQDASVQVSRLQNNSEEWFIKMLFQVDVNCGFFEEVTLYLL